MSYGWRNYSGMTWTDSQLNSEWFLKPQVSVVCYQYSYLCESVVDVSLVCKGTTP